MISLSPEEAGIVSRILALHVPGVEVLVFGSRTRQNHKRFSDLDLVLLTERPLASELLGRLREAFSESDLVFRVDLVDWAATPETTRKTIAAELVPLGAHTG